MHWSLSISKFPPTMHEPDRLTRNQLNITGVIPTATIAILIKMGTYRCRNHHRINNSSPTTFHQRPTLINNNGDQQLFRRRRRNRQSCLFTSPFSEMLNFIWIKLKTKTKGYEKCEEKTKNAKPGMIKTLRFIFCFPAYISPPLSSVSPTEAKT